VLHITACLVGLQFKLKSEYRKLHFNDNPYMVERSKQLQRAHQT